MLMGNIWKLRWFNLCGCIAFVGYGLIISAYPIVVLNSIAGLANIYHIQKIWRESVKFDLVKVDETSVIFKLFLQNFESKIIQQFPQFSTEAVSQAECYLVVKDLQPVGLFAFNSEQGKSAQLVVDYLIPALGLWRFYHTLYIDLFIPLLRDHYSTLSLKLAQVSNIKWYKKIGYKESNEELIFNLSKSSQRGH